MDCKLSSLQQCTLSVPFLAITSNLTHPPTQTGQNINWCRLSKLIFVAAVSLMTGLTTFCQTEQNDERGKCIL